MNYRDAILKVIAIEVLGPKWAAGKSSSQIYSAVKNSVAKAVKNDNGGLTKFGISQRSYPDLDIKNLSLDSAINIYKRDYWDKIKGDKIKRFTIAFAIFDKAVNSGVETSVIQAQRVLSVKVDGKVGPDTLNALNSVLERDFLSRFLTVSIDAYAKIIANNPTQEKFKDGWNARVDLVKSFTFENLGSVNAVSISTGVILFALGFFLLITMSKKGRMA